MQTQHWTLFFTNVGLNSTLVVKLSVLFDFDGALKPALKPALTLLVFLLVCHANPTLNANNYLCNDVGLYPTFSPFSNSKMKQAVTIDCRAKECHKANDTV